MSNALVVIPRREGKPESFGYVRCKEHDDEATIAYERPDGTIALFRRAKGTKPWVRVW